MVRKIDGITRGEQTVDLRSKQDELRGNQIVEDSAKRNFIKAIGVLGVGAFLFSLIPKKAQALVFGSEMKSSDNAGYPSGTGTNAAVTITTSATAVPASAPTKNYVLALYNGSDTDMYVGYQNTNSNGILLPSGGVMSLDIGYGSVSQVYVYHSGSGNKTLSISYKLVN
jgi:hypothetical protein